MSADDDLTTIDPMDRDGSDFLESSRTFDPALARSPDELGLERFTRVREPSGGLDSSKTLPGQDPEPASPGGLAKGGSVPWDVESLLFTTPRPAAHTVRPASEDEPEGDITGLWGDKNHGFGTQTGLSVRISGRYQEVAGQGQCGMGDAMLVEHVQQRKEFALDFLLAEQLGLPDVVESHLQRAKAAAQLKHPHLVPIIDYGFDQRFGVYLVMEYREGASLEACLMDGERFQVKEALRIALQLAKALHYLHSQEFVLCDLHPDEVLLNAPKNPQHARRVTLIDFGLKRGKGPGFCTTVRNGSRESPFASPERRRGVTPAPTMDVYTLGVLLGWMLTGRRPELDAPSPTDSQAGTLDPQLQGLLARLVAKRPEDRLSSMAQVVYQIRALKESLEQEAERASHPQLSAEVAAAPADEELSIVFETCPLPLFLLDPRGRILRVNPAFSNFLRTPERELVGQRIHETRLHTYYSDIESDLHMLISTARSNSLRRVLIIPAGGEQVLLAALLIVPRRDAGGLVTHLCGTVHQLQ